MNSIIEKIHEVTRKSGFSRITTEMGTEAGAIFLCKNHGYVHTLTPEKNNRYTH